MGWFELWCGFVLGGCVMDSNGLCFTYLALK